MFRVNMKINFHDEKEMKSSEVKQGRLSTFIVVSFSIIGAVMLMTNRSIWESELDTNQQSNHLYTVNVLAIQLNQYLFHTLMVENLLIIFASIVVLYALYPNKPEELVRRKHAFTPYISVQFIILITTFNKILMFL